MKKLIATTLCIVFLFSLFGCTRIGYDTAETRSPVKNEKSIRHALVGTWTNQTADGVILDHLLFVFYADGTVITGTKNVVESGGGNVATYELEEGKIIVTYESGDSGYYIYSFYAGELKLKTESAGHWNMCKL